MLPGDEIHNNASNDVNNKDCKDECHQSCNVRKVDVSDKLYLIQEYLDKKNKKWKILAVIAIVLWLQTLFQLNGLSIEVKNDCVGLIEVNDMIVSGILDDELKKVSDQDNVKALILKVDSGGGTVAGSEELYDKLHKIKIKKPIVVVMGGMATSGAYMISLASDSIFAHNSTITGSIGVLAEMPNFSKLLDYIGINYYRFKSSPLKASPSPFEELSDEAKASLMRVINDQYDYFIDLVSKGRKMDKDYVRTLADGRVFTGREALKLGLVDAIGGVDEALVFLQKHKSINTSLKITRIEAHETDKLMKLLIDNVQNRVMSAMKSMFAAVM